MATLYGSGYGGDMRAGMYGQTSSDEEERRRRQQATPQTAPQRPAQPQQAQPQQAQPQQAQPQQAQPQGIEPVGVVPPVNRQAPAAPPPFRRQPTFAEMQKQGQARPAPPMPSQGAPPSPGLYDEQAYNPIEQRAFSRDSVDPTMGSSAPSFGGDIGDYLAQGINSVRQGSVPDAYRPSPQMIEKAAELGRMQQVGLPTYKVDTDLMNRVRALTGQPPMMTRASAPSAGAPPAAPSGVSAAGIDPVAAASDVPYYQQQPNESGAAYMARAQRENFAPMSGTREFVKSPQESMNDYQTRVLLQSNPEATYLQGQSSDGFAINLSGERLAQERARLGLGGAGGGAADGAAGGGTPAGGAAGAPAGAGGGGAPAGAAGGAGGASVDALTGQALADALRNPSAFDNEAVQQAYSRMGQDIDDRFSQQQTALREEMAARGLSDSSIMGGRLSDLNGGQRQARTELATQLGMQRAQDFAGARNAAIGLGMQSQGNALQAELGRGNLSLGQQRASADLELGRGNLSLGQQRLAQDAQAAQFGQQMTGLQFQNQLGQQEFANALDQARFGLGRQGQEFQQGMTSLQFQNQLGQQGFDNSMSRANLQRGFGSDAYSQRMGYLDRLTGYGQQAFDNDMRRAEINRLLQNDQDRFFLQMLGLGG